MSEAKRKTLTAIGDSHSILFCWSSTVQEHWLGWSPLPITMYRLGSEGINLADVARVVGAGHEKHPVLPNDVVIYCYGAIDVGRRIPEQLLLHPQTSAQTIIDTLVSKYLDQIQKNEQLYGVKSVVYAPPPCSRLEGSTDFPAPLQQRVAISKLMHTTLKEETAKRGIPLLDLYDEFADPVVGCIAADLSAKDGIHVDQAHAAFVESKLHELLKSCGLMPSLK